MTVSLEINNAGFIACICRACIISVFVFSCQKSVLSVDDNRNVYGQNSIDSVILTNASKHYLKNIFQVYASNITGVISEKHFEDLLNAINIGKASNLSGKRRTRHHNNNLNGNPKRNENHDASEMSIKSVQEQQESKKSGTVTSSSRSVNKPKKCPSRKELLKEHGIKAKTGISEEKFLQLCPALVYYMETCSSGNGTDECNMALKTEHTDKLIKVWGYGLLSITIISLTSLLVIIIIPIIGQAVYNKVMSFLVALAVGSMVGDALLHLIPHAILPSMHNHMHNCNLGGFDLHFDATLKSCVVLAGIYLFFIVESIIKWRIGDHSHKYVHSGSHTSHQHGVHEVKQEPLMLEDKKTCNISKTCHTHQHHTTALRLSDTQKCNEYCDNGFELSSLIRNSELTKEGVKSEKLCNSCDCEGGNTKSSSSPMTNDGREISRKKKSLSDSALGLRTPDNARSDEYHFVHPIGYTALECGETHCENSSNNSSRTTETTETTSSLERAVVLENKESPDEKVHSGNKNVITSIASVAWMVIISDGFHNFSDGLAVGAAFSTSLATGLTTAIAVFCHEIPHELGDFAILIKSGMSIKHALAYNIVSALVSYIGLIVGIVIGNIESAHTWVLALTAGMFLYISLVGMLPELRNHTSKDGAVDYLCQYSGMLVGILIMLAVALLE